MSGCPGGKPTERGSSEIECSRNVRASEINAPSTPRPRGRSPMRARVSSSMPCVMNRSRAVPLGSITPSAAYRADVTSAAASTIRSRTPSSESSELIARPVCNRTRSRSVSCVFTQTIEPQRLTRSSGRSTMPSRRSSRAGRPQRSRRGLRGPGSGRARRPRGSRRRAAQGGGAGQRGRRGRQVAHPASRRRAWRPCRSRAARPHRHRRGERARSSPTRSARRRRRPGRTRRSGRRRDPGRARRAARFRR